MRSIVPWQENYIGSKSPESEDKDVIDVELHTTGVKIPRTYDSGYVPGSVRLSLSS